MKVCYSQTILIYHVWVFTQHITCMKGKHLAEKQEAFNFKKISIQKP